MEDTVTMTLDRYEGMLAENIRLKNQIEGMNKGAKIEDKTVYNEPMVEWKVIPYYSITAMSSYEYEQMLIDSMATIKEQKIVDPKTTVKEQIMVNQKMMIEYLKKAEEDDNMFEELLKMGKKSSYGGTDPVLRINTEYATTTIKFGTNTYYVALDRSYPNIISEKSFDEGNKFHDYETALLAGKAKVREEIHRAIKRIEEKMQKAEETE